MTKGTRVSPDDFEIGSCITVLNNRRTPWPYGEGPECGILKGSVLKIRSMNLPYILVDAADPQVGLVSLVVDVREHLFQRVARDFADAVIASCHKNKSGEQTPEQPNDCDNTPF